MKRISLRRAAAPLLMLALAFSLALPTSAFFWSKKTEDPYVADFSKNGLIGSTIAFTAGDFAVKPDGKTALSGITIDVLPDPGAGTLCMGDMPVAIGTYVDATALSGLRFQSAQRPTVTTTTLVFTPSFASVQEVPQATATLYLLTQQNNPPVARNMELTTYKNVAITGYFDALLPSSSPPPPPAGRSPWRRTAPASSSTPPMRTRRAPTPSPTWPSTRRATPPPRPRSLCASTSRTPR